LKTFSVDTPLGRGFLQRQTKSIESFEDKKILDAAVIAAAQKVEHYEIASCGCLVTYAKLMKHGGLISYCLKRLRKRKQPIAS